MLLSKNSALFLGYTAYNIVTAFIFFFVISREGLIDLVNKIAVVQLIETVVIYVIQIIPIQIIVKKTAELKNDKKALQKAFHSFMNNVTLTLLIGIVFLLFDPIRGTSDFLVLMYVVFFSMFEVFANMLIGLDMFNKVAKLWFVFFTFRWVLPLFPTEQISTVNDYFVSIMTDWSIGILLVVYVSLVLLMTEFNLMLGVGTITNMDKKLFKESLPVYLYNVSSFLASQGNRVIIVLFIGATYYGIYQFLSLIANVPMLLLSSIFNVVLSVAPKQKPGPDKVKASFYLMTKISILVDIISSMATIVLLPKLFPQYVDYMNVLLLLLQANTLTMPALLLLTFIIALSKNTKPLVLIASVSAFTLLQVTMMLVQSIGLLGCAIAQDLSALVSSVLIISYAYKIGIMGK